MRGYPSSWVLNIIGVEHPYRERRPRHWGRGDQGGYDRNVELVLGILVIAGFVALLVWLID